MRVAVYGATGFIGGAISRALAAAGHNILTFSSPRILGAHQDSRRALDLAEKRQRDACERDLHRAEPEVVINAGGLAGPTNRDADILFGANARMPEILASAVHRTGPIRFLHISSAAVCGSGPITESDETAPETLYGRSKALGEQRVLGVGAPATILRPTSVHHQSRSMTRSIARYARSPLSAVAYPGLSYTPQVQLSNVAAAVAFIVTHQDPPKIVLQPSEELSTHLFLTLLGCGREPRTVTPRLARMPGRIAESRQGTGRFNPISRRWDLLMFGQSQESGWLDQQPYRAVAGIDAWKRLARNCKKAHIHA